MKNWKAYILINVAAASGCGSDGGCGSEHSCVTVAATN